MIVIIGLFVRIVPAFFTETCTNYDIESYYLVSEHVINFEDISTAEDTITRHPYYAVSDVLVWRGKNPLTSHKPLLQFHSAPLLPIHSDISISILIFFFVKRKSVMHAGFYASILYPINPISVYVSVYHGQFDAVPVMSILLSIYSLEKHISLSASPWVSAF